MALWAETRKHHQFQGETQKVFFFVMQVGWIFTDLVSEDTRKGTVRYSRNKVREGRAHSPASRFQTTLACALRASAQLELALPADLFSAFIKCF